MGVKNSVLTPGSRDDAIKAGAPNVQATKSTAISVEGKKSFYSIDLRLLAGRTR